MATQQKESLTLVPAHLLVGHHETTTQQTQNWLSTLLCPDHGCATCTPCDQIKRRQHHAITWLTPEKNYTRDELLPIFNRIMFRLDEHERHFFVLENAELLLPGAANSLLKALENPPAGYHFIFLTQRLSSVLPTIQSRCLVTHYREENTSQHTSALAHFFIDLPSFDPLAFIKALEKQNPSEQEVSHLFEYLLSQWKHRLNHIRTQQTPQATLHLHTIIDLLCQTIVQPLTPGSAKLACKNLYLQMHDVAR